MRFVCLRLLALHQPGLVAAAGAGLHTAAEGFAGAVLVNQPAVVGVALAQRYQPAVPGYAEMPMWAIATSAFFTILAI